MEDGSWYLQVSIQLLTRLGKLVWASAMGKRPSFPALLAGFPDSRSFNHSYHK